MNKRIICLLLISFLIIFNGCVGKNISIGFKKVEIVDYWEHPNKETLFSLAKLDLNKFEQSIQKINELNPKVRDFIRDNAKKVHKDLAKEEEKAKNK